MPKAPTSTAVENPHGDVRYWHLADIPSCTAHVRFRGQSGHDLLQCKCPLMTQSGHRRPNLIDFENWRRS